MAGPHSPRSLMTDISILRGRTTALEGKVSTLESASQVDPATVAAIQADVAALADRITAVEAELANPS